jgi:phenylpyruvate tautomerase PptA (4-oxalocrotonate tautomerase family)
VFANVEVLVAVDIIASSGVFDSAAEQAVCRSVFDALLVAVDAVDDERIASTIGVVLHVVPAERVMMGGRVASSVRIDVVVPGIALASFRRRRRFIADATAAVVEHATDPSIAERVVVRILHAVDGGWGIGGQAFTNDFLDEGPE